MANQETEPKIETVAAITTVEELALRVSKIEGDLANTTKIAKRGAIGVAIAAGMAVTAFVLRKKLKKAKKKAEKLEAEKAEAEKA